MTNLNATTNLAHFHCLQAERMEQADHERLVHQALHNRRSRISSPENKSESGRQHVGRALNEASRP